MSATVLILQLQSVDRSESLGNTSIGTDMSPENTHALEPAERAR